MILIRFDQWQPRTLNLDGLNTTISISDSIFPVNPNSLRIDYQFTYQTSIPNTQYRAYLETKSAAPLASQILC